MVPNGWVSSGCWRFSADLLGIPTMGTREQDRYSGAVGSD